MKNIDAEIQKIYERMVPDIQKEIESFYQRYADKEGISLAEAKKRVSKFDVRAFEARAAKMVKERDFSDEANELMRLYNATMRINRLELLKADIGLHMIDGFDDLEKLTGERLTEEAVKEFERQAGILGNGVKGASERAKSLVGQSFMNATFSERIWSNQEALRNKLSTILTKGLIGGKSYQSLAAEIRKDFNVSAMEAKRLVRTEMVRVQTQAQIDSYKANGWEEFEFLAYGTASCEICNSLNKKHFKISEFQPAENAPPMHPNCRCWTAPYEDEGEYQKWLDSFEKEASGKSAGNGEDGSGTITRRVKKIDFSNVSAIMSLINQTKEYYQNFPNEYDITITATGNVYLSKGLHGGVKPKIDEDRTGAFSYHNHPPKETNFSFSGEDVRDFIKNKEAFMMASDYKYQYTLKRRKDTKDINYKEVMSMHKEAYKKALDNLKKRGKSIEDIDEELFNESMNILSKELNLEYERTLQSR